MNSADFKAFIDENLAAHPAERKVLRKIVKALKDNGTPVTEVYDTEEYTKVSSLRSIQEQVFNLDEAWLLTESGSWVRFTMGNEWDCLTDYTTDLEEALAPISEYINKKWDEE